MLNTCDEHDDCKVVYDGKECPVCNIVKDKEYFDEKIGELENEKDELKQEIAHLEKALENQ